MDLLWQRRKSYRAYRHWLRKTKRKMARFCKKQKMPYFDDGWAPWDWGYTMYAFRMMLQAMLEYHTNYSQVPVMDDDRSFKIFTLHHAIELFDKAWFTMQAGEDERLLYKDFFDYVANYMFYWWD